MMASPGWFIQFGKPDRFIYSHPCWALLNCFGNGDL